jgi:acyl-coenzyme A synthetase/AMP-(fatty) acid ligase
MIFDIDLKPQESLAIKDDSGFEITYGQLSKHIQESLVTLPKRSLVLVLACNDTATATFILTCLEHQWVPLVINEDTDAQLIDKYVIDYHPSAIFSSQTKLNTLKIDFLNQTHWFDKSIYVLNEKKHNLFPNLSLLLPTSGSTGSPKLVRHSYENLSFSALNVSKLFAITPKDVGMAILPIYYTMGFSVLTSHLHAGAQVRLSKYPLTDRGFWDALKNDNISILTGVPYTFEVLFKMRFERVRIPSLRIITQGGGKLSEILWQKLTSYAESNQVQFIPTYGQTEGTARMAYLESGYVTSKSGSIGKPIPNGTFEIWDNNGNPIEEKEAEGELVYKGGNVTLGYAECEDDLNKGDERFGLLPTGDIVRRDVDGFYYIIGRNKRFLKIYGLRISLDEVENLIKNNFELDCYSEGSDEVLVVYIDSKYLISDVKMWLSHKINLFHHAIEVRFVESIPRNSFGKVVFT